MTEGKNPLGLAKVTEGHCWPELAVLMEGQKRRKLGRQLAASTVSAVPPFTKTVCTRCFVLVKTRVSFDQARISAHAPSCSL